MKLSEPRLDVYMGILGFLVLIINCVTMMLTFPRKYKLYYEICAITLMTVVTMVYRRLTVDFIHYNGLSAFFYLFLMYWLLKGPIFQKTFAFFFQYIFTVSLLYLSEAVVGIFIEPTGEHFTLVLFIPTMILYIVYIFLMYKYGRRMFQKLLVDGRTAEWALYSFGAVFSFVVLTVSRDYPNSTLLHILSLLFIIWSFFVLCFAVINTHEKSRQRYEAELARSIVSSGREHYQKMNGMYDALRVLRHDYKYHLNTIGELVNAGNRDEIKNYLADVKVLVSANELPHYCPNSIINALLSQYADRCKSLNIRYDIQLSIPEILSIPSYEICIILGNLLENAIEACVKRERGRWIELSVKAQGEQLATMVRNSFDGVMATADGQPVSTKKDGGFGLRSIQAISARHDGQILTNWDDDTFSISVLLRM